MDCVKPSIKRRRDESRQAFNTAVHNVFGINKRCNNIVDSFAVVAQKIDGLSSDKNHFSRLPIEDVWHLLANQFEALCPLLRITHLFVLADEELIGAIQ